MYTKLLCRPVISFFFKPYPTTDTYVHDMAKKLEKPGKLAKYILYNRKNIQLGAVSFLPYGGFYEASNPIGQTLYPRKHVDSTVFILITSRITPVIMLQNTVHHWQLQQGVPAQIFQMQRKKDAMLETVYWDVKEVPLPANNVVPLRSIVIFAKPKNIYVPTGITMTKDSPNLLLPTMYAKKGINKVANALFVMNISHLLGPVNSLYKKEPTEYQQHITS